MADTGIISGILRNFQPDKPNIKAYRAIFDQPVFKDTNALLDDWKTNRGAWKDTYSKWLGDFNKQTPEITSNVNQENSFLKWIQGGGLDKQLSSLRTKEGSADKLAQKNALDFAGNNAGYADLVTGGGGGRTSSADYARRLASGTRIADEFAQRAPARERADLGTSISLKLGTAGRANANLERLLNRELMPQQLSDGELRELSGALGGITNIRNAVSQPVFWRKKSGMEQAANILDSLAQGAEKGMKAYSSFSGIGGGMGGMGGGSGTPDTGEAPVSYGSSNAMSVGMPEGPNSGTGEGNYVPQQIPATAPAGSGYYPGPMMQYQQPPNYSPGNDPNFWKKFDGGNTFG